MLPQVAASFAPGSTDKVIKSGIARAGNCSSWIYNSSTIEYVGNFAGIRLVVVD